MFYRDFLDLLQLCFMWLSLQLSPVLFDERLFTANKSNFRGSFLGRSVVLVETVSWQMMWTNSSLVCKVSFFTLFLLLLPLHTLNLKLCAFAEIYTFLNIPNFHHYFLLFLTCWFYFLNDCIPNVRKVGITGINYKVHTCFTGKET